MKRILIITGIVAGSKIGGDLRAEPGCPKADRFVAHVDAAVSEHFLDITQAEREAKVEPDRMLYHGWWEAPPLVGNSRHRGSSGGANSHCPYQRLASIGLTAPAHT